MGKIKNFSLVRATKFLSEKKNENILPKQYLEALGKVIFSLENHLGIVDNKNVCHASRTNKLEDEKQYVQNSEKESINKLILYKPPLGSKLPNFPIELRLNPTGTCTEWMRFLRNMEDTNKSKALVPWWYNHETLVSCENPLVRLLNKGTSSLKENSELPHHDKTQTLQGCSSKFAENLTEILEETKYAEVFPSTTGTAIAISRNCESCPAVVQIKNFSSKLPPKRKESKILLLSHHNYEKFEKTYTRLLAKDKVKLVKPLIRNLKNQDQVMTKLERAIINHNSRTKKNDTIKRNIIVMQSKVIETMRSQSDVKETPSSIMIVNDEIFKGSKNNQKNGPHCKIHEEKRKIIYLNNSIFKELNKSEVNKIVNRKYSGRKEKIPLRVPSRHTLNKLEPLRLPKNVEEYEDVTLKNLIAAVAEKKRLDYIERSKMSWQVFKQCEETIQKTTILKFPLEEMSDSNHSFESNQKKLKPKKVENKTGPIKDKVKYDKPNKEELAVSNVKIKKTKSIKDNVTDQPSNNKIKIHKKKVYDKKYKNDMKNTSLVRLAENPVSIKTNSKYEKTDSKPAGIKFNREARIPPTVSDKLNEEFINLKKGANLSFKDNNSCLFIEKESPTIEVLHIKKKKSPLSSSQSEFLGELVEKPRRLWKKRAPSKDIENETETNLVVQELLSERNKNIPSKHLRKTETPILGTPTTIAKQIEKVAATALATKIIREKFNEEKNAQMCRERRNKKRNIEKIDKRKSSELEEFKVKMNDSEVVTEKIQDETVTINSTVQPTECDNKKKLKEKLENGSACTQNMKIEDIHKEERNKKIPITHLKKSKIPILGTPTSIAKKIEEAATTEFVRKMMTEKFNEEKTRVMPNERKNKNMKIEEMDKIRSDELKEFDVKQNNSDVKSKQIQEEGRLQIDEILALSSSTLKPADVEDDKNKRLEKGSEQQEKSAEIRTQNIEAENIQNEEKNTDNVGKVDYNNNLSKSKESEEDFEHKKKFNSNVDEERREQNQDNNQCTNNMENEDWNKKEETSTNISTDTKTINDDKIEKFGQIPCDTQKVVDSEIISQQKNEKNFELGTSSTGHKHILTDDKETIRKKRLIYFGEKMKNNIDQKSLKNNKTSCKNEVENKLTTMNSINNARFGEIADKRDLNDLRGNEKHTQKKNCFSQCEMQTRTEVKETGIETDSNHRDTTEIFGTQKDGNHRTLKRSVSDNVIVKGAARKDSKETVENIQDITKSFLKKLQCQMNFLMERTAPNLRNQAVRKCKEIALKLRKSQEKLLRNLPASVHKFCREAKKISKNLPKNNIIAKKSREFLNTFNNSNFKRTTYNGKLRGAGKLSQKSESLVMSSIEQKITNKMKLLRNTSSNKMKNTKCRTDDEKLIPVPERRKIRRDLSVSEVQNPSIGSLFADTVASALAKCGDVEKIMSKYSDSQNKYIKAGYEENSPKMKRNVLVEKEDEFLMNDGVRKLVLHVTLEKNEDKRDGQEWKCYSKAVLVKNSVETLKKHTQNGDVSRTPSLTEIETRHDNSRVPSSIFEECEGSPRFYSEEITTKIEDDETNSEALQKLEKDLLNLKKCLQRERASNEIMKSTDAEEVVLFKNNESFVLKDLKVDNNTPKSFEDLLGDLVSERTSSITEGSTLPPPPMSEDATNPNESNFGSSISERQEDIISNKELDLKSIPDVALDDTLEVFVTPQTSRIELKEPIFSGSKLVEDVLISDVLSSFDVEIPKLSVKIDLNSSQPTMVFREKKKSIEEVENVCNNLKEMENLNEVFIDLERMGNCILKTSGSKDDISKETYTVSNKTPARSFGTANSSKSYSGFRDVKSKATKNNERRDDYKELEEIHEEALRNEVFFGKRNEKSQEETEDKDSDKERNKAFIYHEIVRMSELNDFEMKKAKESTNSEKKKSDEIVEFVDNIEESLLQRSCSSKLIKETGEFHEQIVETKDIVPEVQTKGTTEKKEEDTDVKENEEEQTSEIPERIETVTEAKSGIEKESVVIEENLNEERIGTVDKILNDSKQHRILEKFAMMSQEPDSEIFKINDEIKFDRTKKRLCQLEKVGATKRKTHLGKSVEKPRMILHLTPSKELYSPRTEKSDIDLKKMLRENPKNLMQIASTILNKNQYLNFLLDLKSSKDLKDYWMRRLKEGIASSRSLSNLVKLIDFARSKTELLDPKKAEEKDERKLSEGMSENEKTETDFPTESDMESRQKKTGLDIETDNSRPNTAESSRTSRILKHESSHDRTNKRNLSFQHKEFLDHPLPYTLEKYLDSPLEKVNTDEESLHRKIRNFEANRFVEEKEGRAPERKDYNPAMSQGYHMSEDEDTGAIRQDTDGIEDRIGIFKTVNREVQGVERPYGSGRRSEDEVIDKREQQTAIVLPGREPIKVSLISEDVPGRIPCSMSDQLEKNALENLSDVLSNCSTPLSSACGSSSSRRRKTAFKRSRKGEILKGNSPINTSTSLRPENLQCPSEKQPTNSRSHRKKFENPLRKFVRKHEENQTKVTAEVSNNEKNEVSFRGDTKIRVFKTKSLSEILREDPNALKKIRQNMDQTENPSRRFEYRFHDFRRKEDVCVEMKAKRQEEQKKDIMEKFKGLIHSRKVAAKQNLKTNDNQQQPQVFSKILDKINYFKELEVEPDGGKKEKMGGSKGISTKTNRRFLHTKKKRINEDELETWVQEHPGTPIKRTTLENGGFSDVDKQNVIHIPWTPTCKVGADN